MTNFKDRTIIFIATVPWSYNWQRQHEWTTRLARANRVLFVQPFGMNNLGPLKILKKLIERKSKSSFNHELDKDTSQNLSFIYPKIIPWHDVPIINRINGWLLAKQIRSHTLCPDHELIFWVCNPADTVLHLIKRFKKPVVVYDIAMRFLKRSDCPTYLEKSQADLAERAEIIISDSKASTSDLPFKVLNKVSYVPQGLNQKLLTQVPPNVKIKDLAGPKIIYLGANHDSLENQIFSDILSQIPQAQLILTFNKPELQNGQNDWVNNKRAHFIGPIQFKEVNATLRSADVGIIPYKINEFTEGVFPTKMFEYLACNLPVVSSALPELMQYREHLDLANNSTEFISLVKKAIAQGKNRTDLNFLKKQTWEKRFENILEVLVLKEKQRT